MYFSVFSVPRPSGLVRRICSKKISIWTEVGNLRAWDVLKLAVAWLLMLVYGSAVAQSAVDGFNPSANDRVAALLVQPDGKIVAAGAFTQLGGVPRRGIARINADGSVDPSLVSVANGDVNALAIQADGKLLIGGDFTQIDGQPHVGIARFNADGSLDAGFTSTVYAAAGAGIRSLAVQADGKILVGGRIVTVNGSASRAGIARLNADGSVDNGFNPWVIGGSGVSAITVQKDGRILVGGNFTQVGGKPRAGLARLNSDGTVDDIFSPGFSPSENINVMSVVEQPGGKIVVGGDFLTVSGQSRKGIARLNADGSLDSAFNLNMMGASNGIYPSVVAIVAQNDGKIVVGGSFGQIGGQWRTNIAKLKVDGTVDADFNTSAGGAVYSLAVQADDKLLLGGIFADVGSVNLRRNIARLNMDGTPDVDFQAQTDGSVLATAIQSDGQIVAGGNFSAGANFSNNSFVGRLRSNGTWDANFSATLDSAVTSLIVQPDGKLVLGGYFTKVNNQSRKNMARVNADGSIDAGFQAGVEGLVTKLLLQPDGKILAAGNFPHAQNQPSQLLVRLNGDGSLDTGFNSAAGFNITSVALQEDGKILVGGNLLGPRSGNVARLNADGSIDTSFSAGIKNFDTYGLWVVSDGGIIVSGSFYRDDTGPSQYGLMKLDASGNVVPAFVFWANDRINDLSVQADGKLIVAGLFTQLNGNERIRIARINANGAIDENLNVAVDAGINSLALQMDGKIFLGGQFSSVAGQSRARIARLSVPEAALQSLQVSNDGTRLSWMRSGTGPVATNVRFSMATTSNAAENDWTDLGPGTRIPGGWSIGALNFQRGTPLWIRARGSVAGNGSQSMVQAVRMIQLPALPATPSGVAVVAGDGQVRVSWSQPDGNGSAITGYAVTGAPGGTCTAVAPATSCLVTGLNNGTLYAFTVTATTGVGTGPASSPVQATPLALASSAPAALPGSAGQASVSIAGAPAGCSLASLSIDANAPSAPAGANFPMGVLRFSVNGCAGATLSVRITYPQSVAGLQLRKYGPPAAGRPFTWFTPSNLQVSGDGRTVSYTVTDDGEGDNETGTPGTITDPFAPMQVTPSATPVNAAPIPVLGPWGLALMGLLAGMIGVGGLRRRTA
ncbi:hypothetical protein C7Y68_13675 [Paracidovorax avenae]|uniref:IPTL-CTERM sorting domain-containing protein n=1 Tax=Paracidovorax avenae TaxID=80867 RepID=UPI000D16D284|nr:IPTL-CTERM sorting domain-containing protein [Paracidovorax avenae]AVT06504.1 hypothetical protein C8248_11480 [Paracidovorax avenae]AVT20911.1 hypothetical protein C7Y68_13675 [Paracidovorax avenae]